MTGVTYRHPGLLVKTVTTLDVLSGGRAWLGIGAAWNEQEHRGLGVPFPLDRASGSSGWRRRCRSRTRCGAATTSPTRGATTTSSGRSTRPQRSPRPHPPILVGGVGEQKTLRLVAQYADACNVFDMGPDKVRAKYDVIRRHCEDVGRDYDAIEKTVAAPGRPVDASRSTSVVDRLGRLRRGRDAARDRRDDRRWSSRGPSTVCAALVAKLG